ncbi:site-specific integrase [Cytobacillus horneckiae]|uniref:site-specific integrase n=1 Tax=Cytobacillus horneckiae TaxID=549687 RepID=UPI00203C3B40|nr:site-specific integrase [Cytobacillus horneckiae]MCM3180194.1 site-specific integrase [Cytobacillus horneckiae]
MKGYIRKRGTKWSYTVDIGKDPKTGKRRQRSKSGYKTKKEAQAALAELVNNVEKGKVVEASSRYFNEFTIEYMDKTYKNRVKASTYDRTMSLINTHILPWFENIQLKDINPFMVHEFYDEKIKEYTPSYVQRMHEIMRRILYKAFEWELILKDVASRLEPPKKEKTVLDVWSVQNVNDYLKFTKHSRYHPIFYLAAHTGMRKGEILGLSWEDVDFESRKLKINKTLYKITGEFLLQSPKSYSSIRTIYMDDDLIRVLKKQKVKQNIEKMKFGTVYKEHNMVFAQETGEFINPTAVNQLFTRFIKQSKLPYIRFHDLRHTHATILLQMGVNPKLVADRLGHSSVKITLDIYSHVLPEMQQNLTDQFSKAMKSGQIVSN